MANLANSAKADKAISIEDFIALRDTDEITYYNYSVLEYLNGYEMFVTNILYDYEDEINENIVILELTDKERAKYRYKPYLLAYDIYGSTELKFIIMMLNGIIDPKEFDLSRIKILYKSTLSNLLGHIDPVNEMFLKKNRARIDDAFKNSNGNSIWIEDDE